MLKLYDYPQCPYGQKTRIVLAEKQLDYEFELVDLRNNGQHSPEFAMLNPLHKVPVLVEEYDGEIEMVVQESTIINEYLEDEYPEPALLPRADDSAARARIRELEDHADQLFVLAAGTLIAEHAKPAETRDPERLRRAKEEVDKTFRRLEDELEGGRIWLGGDQFTIADAAFAPRLLLLSQRGVELPASMPQLRGYVDRLSKRESIRRLGAF